MSQDSPRDERVVSITIQAPVERVWDEITKTGTLQPAVYNTVLDCDMTPGSRLRYYSQNKKRVFVVGEVRNGGRFDMQGPTTVMQAIALALAVCVLAATSCFHILLNVNRPMSCMRLCLCAST